MKARAAAGWSIDEAQYWMVLPLIAAWPLSCLVLIAVAAKRNSREAP